MDIGRPSLKGPWGGSQGSEWSYTPNCGSITLVTIGYNRTAIQSLVFQSKDGKTATFGGGSGQPPVSKGQPPVSKVDVAIDFPNEYITGISGYTNRIASLATTVVTSLNIFTNLKEYGPFGPESGNTFTFRPKDNSLMITGFFGCSGRYIDAIGVYYKPCLKITLIENIRITEGPWGGPNGDEWSFEPQSDNIMQIAVAHSNGFIASLTFHSQDGETGTFGETTASKDYIYIDYPNEFLTGISGYTYHMENLSTPSVVIRSLKFYTNRKEYGPYGRELGEQFLFRLEENSGMITGFFGRSDLHIDAIGLYYKFLEKGPWDGEHVQWFDDGVFSKIKQIHVHLVNDFISAIQIEYVNKQGDAHWSMMHGKCGEVVARIEIESEDEFLTGIHGYHGPVDEGSHGPSQGSVGVDVIKSLTFYTNKGKYGPVGIEIGECFRSEADKVVGFSGKYGKYLNVLSIHTESL